MVHLGFREIQDLQITINRRQEYHFFSIGGHLPIVIRYWEGSFQRVRNPPYSIAFQIKLKDIGVRFAHAQRDDEQLVIGPPSIGAIYGYFFG